MNADRREKKPTGGGRQRMKPAWKEQTGGSCAVFIKSKKMFPKKTIWCYTGYAYDKDILPSNGKKTLRLYRAIFKLH